MAHDDSTDLDRWVDARLGALTNSPAERTDPAARLAEIYTRRAAARSRRRRWAGAAAVVTIIAVTVPEARALGARCVEACVSATARAATFWRQGEPEAARSPVVGPLVGDLAPDLLGEDPAGVPVRLASFRGHVVLVNFWATWCAPCQAEIPIFNALAAELGPRGLDVIGVSLDDGWAAVASFAPHRLDYRVASNASATGATRLDYHVVLGSNEVTSAFGGVDALPLTFVIDREGRIIMKHVGVAEDGAFDGVLEKLLR